MIVKSIRHTTPSFDYIIDYLYDGMPKDQERCWEERVNLSRGPNRDDIIQEFEENSEFLYKRSSLKRMKTTKYHEILGFSRKSSQYLNNEKLRRIAKEYFKIRDPERSALGICVPHIEKGRHFHLHFVFSSNHIGSSKASDLRMSNARYYEIRRSIERFMLKEFPELHHSVVYLKERELQELLPKEYLEQRESPKVRPAKNFGKQTKKQELAEMLQSLMDQSSTFSDFISKMDNTEGLCSYSRNGKLAGVIKDGKKYRLKTLGITQISENVKVLERMEELDSLQRNRVNQHEQNLER